MALKPEVKIKRKLVAMLKARNIYSFSPSAGIYGASGIPDRIAVVEGKFIGIECKADKTKKITALQRVCKDNIEQSGGKYYVVYDTETIEKLGVILDVIRSENRSNTTKR